MGIAERREREREQRRSDIVDAAERVFFDKGWQIATMDDVAAEAELGKATLYLYFKRKEELYEAILVRGSRVLHGLFRDAVAAGGTGLVKTEAIGRAYIRYFAEYRDYFDAMLYFEAQGNEPSVESEYAAECARLREEIMGLVAGAVAAGIDDGSIRPGLDPMEAAILLWAQTTGVLLVVTKNEQAIRELHGLPAADIIESYFDFVFHALAVPGTERPPRPQGRVS